MEAARVIDLDTVRIRLSRLLEQATEVIRSHYRSELSLQDFVDAARFREWRVGCLAFLKEAFGSDSHYLKEYEFSCDSPYLNAAARGQAVLRAAREYIDFGPVARVEELAAAEVFNDLLAIAKRHCGAGRTSAAAVLAAAILEDVLWRNARNRRLAVREQIDGPAEVNQKLLEAGVYPAAIKQKIIGWIELAGRATVSESAPGENLAGVAAMVTGVRDFVADFLI